MNDESISAQEIEVPAEVAQDVTDNVSEPVIEPVAESAPADPLAGIKPRTAHKGKVTRTDLGGAFVDIGANVEGYVHISQIVSDKPVTRVADVLKSGDEIDVYVGRVNPARKRVELSMIKPPTYDWDNLAVGSQLTDVKVVAVESFGAFVDIDGPKHGLVPFNLMPKGDRPKVGDALPLVWVIEVNAEKRRIGLTMVEPPDRPWESIKKGDQLRGRVTRIERIGAYVDIGAEREGLIRTSSFGAGFVNVSNFVSVGEEVPVRVAKVDTQKKQIDLVMEGINSEEFSLSSGPEETISPFAAAMQRAQKVKKAQERAQERAGKKS